MPGGGGDADDDLLAVGDATGQVQAHGVGPLQRAAGRRHRVGDAGARRQRDQSGLVNQPDDADHHRLIRR